jgi:hypothetical protein
MIFGAMSSEVGRLDSETDSIPSKLCKSQQLSDKQRMNESSGGGGGEPTGIDRFMTSSGVSSVASTAEGTAQVFVWLPTETKRKENK